MSAKGRSEMSLSLATRDPWPASRPAGQHGLSGALDIYEELIILSDFLNLLE